MLIVSPWYCPTSASLNGVTCVITFFISLISSPHLWIYFASSSTGTATDGAPRPLGTATAGHRDCRAPRPPGTATAGHGDRQGAIWGRHGPKLYLFGGSSSSPTQFFNVKMDHFDFSHAPLLHRRFILTNQRRVFVVSMTFKRCGTRIGLLPVFAGRGRRPPLLSRAHDVASVPRALIGGNPIFRRRITTVTRVFSSSSSSSSFGARFGKWVKILRGRL